MRPVPSPSENASRSAGSSSTGWSSAAVAVPAAPAASLSPAAPAAVGVSRSCSSRYLRNDNASRRLGCEMQGVRLLHLGFICRVGMDCSHSVGWKMPKGLL